jgi:hypothetical protein
MALKLTVLNENPILTGVEPGVFVEVRIQDTARGGTKVLVKQADHSGSASFHYPNFDMDKSVHVRVLIPGQDTILHHLIFTKESTPVAPVLVDADDHSAPEPVQSPRTIQEALEKMAQAEHQEATPIAPVPAQGE